MSFWLNLLLGIFILVLIIKSVIIVNQFELGLVFRLGKVRGRLNPGVNFIIPFIDVPIKVDVRITSYNVCYTKLLRTKLPSSLAEDKIT